MRNPVKSRTIVPLPGNQLHPFLDPANSFQTADLGIKIIVFNYFDVRQSTLDKAFVFFLFFFWFVCCFFLFPFFSLSKHAYISLYLAI